MDLTGAGRIAGVDEAGRGPLAGPVVAAAVLALPAEYPALYALCEAAAWLDEAMAAPATMPTAIPAAAAPAEDELLQL